MYTICKVWCIIWEEITVDLKTIKKIYSKILALKDRLYVTFHTCHILWRIVKSGHNLIIKLSAIFTHSKDKTRNQIMHNLS